MSKESIGFIAFYLIVAAFLLGYFIGHDNYQSEAVKRHYAEWYLDENNKVKWRWIEPTTATSERSGR